MAPPIPPLFGAGPPHGPPPRREYSDEELVPKGIYYDLPAGMMVPLIKAEDCTFKSLKPDDLRLPPPEPPTEHLIRELERFYNFHPTPENPRDAEGWEQKGLFDFYVRKAEHKVKLEEKMKREGKTIEDAITNKFVKENDEAVSDDERRNRGRRSSSTSSSSSSGSSSSDSSSSSNSAERHRRRRKRSKSRSKSRSRSRSASPRRRRRSRSATPEEVRPGFGASTSGGFKVPPLPLDREQNKGAQLMAKMGWEGRGLGAKEQGIEEPVHGGEVRDRVDQFRGVGSKPDIYEEYRKQMSMRKFGGRQTF